MILGDFGRCLPLSFKPSADGISFSFQGSIGSAMVFLGGVFFDLFLLYAAMRSVILSMSIVDQNVFTMDLRLRSVFGHGIQSTLDTGLETISFFSP